MFLKIKQLLGLQPSPEKWDKLKSDALEAILGPEHNMVMHAIIPFSVGGGLDLYYYPQKTGFAVATKELIDEFGNGPKNRDFPAFELCMFSPITFNLDLANDFQSPMGTAHRRINATLNALALYASQKTLNINDTIEFPMDFDEELGGQCFIVTAITKHDRPLVINNKNFGLMVAINIHRAEMNYAREFGGADLISKLTAAGIFPNSTLEREPVV
ncbi:hypothetical protein [Holophaga foetida]|uniref:hypothetical protein n=1 Tax=Holophaga foetida TaxID=35839 RepID=UPI00024745D8|nr:hypothetical protein [Holophaga foetida]